MLERVKTCVEPRIGLWVSRLEIPPPTKRALHPAFWHQGSHHDDIPHWWSAYLQSIREIKAPKSVGQNRSITKLEHHLDLRSRTHAAGLSSACRKPKSRATSESSPLTPRQRGGRMYSVASEPPAENYEHIRETGRPGETKRSLYRPPGQKDVLSTNEEDRPVSDAEAEIISTGGPFSISLENPPGTSVSESPLQRLQALLQSDDSRAFNRVWQLFSNLEESAPVAGGVLKYLAASNDAKDLDHALRAYSLMTVGDRDSSHYYAAVGAACRCKQADLALEIYSEAMDRDSYRGALGTLLAFLIRSNSWDVAAAVWNSLPLSEKSAATPGNQALWEDVDQLYELPAQLARFIQRLQPEDPKDPELRRLLMAFGTQLLFRVFLSPTIMAQITASGTLDLLDHFFYLDLLQPHHYFVGIQTLNRMVDARNRHQLATLLYRNMNMRFPKVCLPRSVLGCMIGILCSSEGEYGASRVVLRRFATDHGKADEKAYQRVLTACAENGDSRQVQAVFEEYRQAYHRPRNMAFLTPLLYVHARVGNVAATKGQFDRLEKDFGMTPNTYCWNILITAYSRARDFEGAFRTFREMRQARLSPDHYTFGTLMALCATSGDTETLHGLVELAKKHRIASNTAMIDSLVHSYCLDDRADEAERLAETAIEMQIKGSPTRMWNNLLRHYAFQADTDAVLRIQNRMKALSVPADDMTYAAMMQTLVNVGKTADAASILRELHFNNSVTTTMFHYSIVLYGYASEDNRDMVAVIFNEMQERFPRITPSARMSRLRSYLARDQTVHRQRLKQAVQGDPMAQALRLEKTLDFLADTLMDASPADVARKDPQPGLGRRTGAEAFPAAYFEFLITAFARNGAFSKAIALFDRYLAITNTGGGGIATGGPSIAMLSAVMIALLRQRRFNGVTEFWNKALSIAVERGRQKRVDLSTLSDDTVWQPDKAVRPAFGAVGLQTASDTADAAAKNPFLDQETVKILPAHQYSLAAPLTHYMYSLAYQELEANILPLVGRLEQMGFALTSRNWNQLIQILAYSDDPGVQIIAFRLFEEKLVANMPPWPVLARGKWIPPGNASSSRSSAKPLPVPRTFVERWQPKTLVPTYWTTVYLGLALLKIQKGSSHGNLVGLHRLQRETPRTLAAISKMPLLKDRVQGLLLRGQALKGDPERRPRRPKPADRAGLRGSRSPMDHIPLEAIYDEDMLAHSDQPNTEMESRPNQMDTAQIAATLTGEIQRSPLVLERARRYESDAERTRRIKKESKGRMQLAQELREDASQSRAMANEKFGEPHFEAKLQDDELETLPNDHSKTRSTDQEARDVLARDPEPSSENFESPRAFPDRPAAILSAALQPAAAARRQQQRRRHLQHKKPRALQWSRHPAARMKSDAEEREELEQHFRSDLKSKTQQALVAYQPPQRPTKRSLRAFTMNKAARAARKRERGRLRAEAASALRSAYNRDFRKKRNVKSGKGIS